MGMKASSSWALEIPWIPHQQPQDSLQLLSPPSCLPCFLPSPLDIYLFTWEWSRKPLWASRCAWMGQATLRLACRFSVPRLGFQVLPWILSGRGGKINEAGEEPIDFQKWMTHCGLERQPKVTFSHGRLHIFLLCPLCTLHQMFYGIKPDPGRPVAPFCTPRASYQHVYHTTLCGKRMFTLATQYLQFLCWKRDSGPILQIYLCS